MSKSKAKEPPWKTHPTGERVVRFIENLTVDDDGVIRRFKLRGWQSDIIRQLFGTVRADGFRQYKKLFLGLPRGQGKTTLIAALCLYSLLSMGRGQHIYSASGDREQAALIFECCKGFIKRDPHLESLLEVYDGKKRITYPAKDSHYQALSSDASHPHGLRPGVILFDEVHVFPDRRLHTALVTGLGKRKETLTVYITTAGEDKHSFCYELWEHAVSVMEGKKSDPSLLPIIYAAKETDDWTSPEVWARVMPALGDFYSLEHIESECRLAQEVVYKEIEFRTFYLNQWTERAKRWLDPEQWDLCASDFCAEELAGRTGFLACDLSTTTDLTSLSLLFPPQAPETTYKLISYFFVPRDTARTRERKDKVRYREWAKNKHLIDTPGNSVDYEAIRKFINDLAETYKLEKVGLDPWNATQLAQQLQEDGHDVVFFRQGFQSFNAPSKELERLILTKGIEHQNNPVLRWCVGNVVVDTDPAGNIKPSKVKSTERIDGVVSAIMALGLAIGEQDPEPSISFLSALMDGGGNTR